MQGFEEAGSKVKSGCFHHLHLAMSIYATYHSCGDLRSFMSVGHAKVARLSLLKSEENLEQDSVLMAVND